MTESWRPHRVPRRRRGESFENAFWRRVDRSDPTGCWPWLGGRNNDGYGVLRDEDGRFDQAHRVANRLALGPIPLGVFVLHRCDNPPCCRPDHHRRADQAANLADMREKRRGHDERDGAGRFSPVTPERCPVEGCAARFASRARRLRQHAARPHWRCSCGAVGVDWVAHVRRSRRRGGSGEHVRSAA